MTKSLKREKRVNKRLFHCGSLHYTVMGDCLQPPDIITVSGGMIDISSTGIRFQLREKPPRKGSFLCMRLEVGFANDMVTVPVVVEVLWVKEISADNSHYYVGSRFIL